jgi:Domain of unknown function (DUF4384)
MKLFISLAICALALPAQDPQRIRLTVEREDGTAWKQVNPALVFNAGDHVRFRISANFPGNLYVMNHGTTGSFELLFPRSDTGSDFRIEASMEYVVPASQGWFKVSGPAGQDVIYFMIEPRKRVEEQGYLLPSPPPPRQEPPDSLRPRCDDSILKARGECIDDSAGVRPVKPGETLPSNLSAIGATPRELLFMQDKGSSVLSSQTPLAGPVIYELRLAHR